MFTKVTLEPKYKFSKLAKHIHHTLNVKKIQPQKQFFLSQEIKKNTKRNRKQISELKTNIYHTINGHDSLFKRKKDSDHKQDPNFIV